MEKLKESRGGKRANSGRKKMNAIKKPVTIYIEDGLITTHGKPEIRNKIYQHLKSLENGAKQIN